MPGAHSSPARRIVSTQFAHGCTPWNVPCEFVLNTSRPQIYTLLGSIAVAHSELKLRGCGGIHAPAQLVECYAAMPCGCAVAHYYVTISNQKDNNHINPFAWHTFGVCSRASDSSLRGVVRPLRLRHLFAPSVDKYGKCMSQMENLHRVPGSTRGRQTTFVAGRRSNRRKNYDPCSSTHLLHMWHSSSQYFKVLFATLVGIRCKGI